MIKNKFGVMQFCPSCHSTGLHIHKNEELLSKIGDSDFEEIIVCKRCFSYYTVEFMKEVKK